MTPKKNSLKDKAYDVIKQKITSCKFKPNDFINERDLIDELHVSRTPIREALSRLEQEHLVTILPKRGVIVTDVSMKDVIEIYNVRELIEPYLVENYGKNIDKDELIKLKVLLETRDKTDSDSHYSIDEALHRLLVYSSNNQYFISVMDHIDSQNQRIRILSGEQVEKRLERTSREHLEILNYLISEDWHSAVKAMKFHLKNSKKTAIDLWYKKTISSR